MKVALCLSGQPRFLEQAYNEVLKPYILDVADVDVFVHAWEPDQNQIGKSYVTGGGHQVGPPVSENIVERIVALYKPKAYIIEPQIQFEYGKYPDRVMQEIRSDYLYSQFYSVWKSNIVRKSYTNQNPSIKYDWVIRSRFDVKLNDVINFTLDSNNLYLPTGCFHPAGWVDCFAMSNEHIMDVYCDLYNNIDNIMNTTSIGLCGEFLLNKHLANHNIKPIPTMWHGLYR